MDSSPARAYTLLSPEAFLFDLIKSIRVQPFPYGEENVVESPLCWRELCQQYLLPGKVHKCEKFVTFHRFAGGEKPE